MNSLFLIVPIFFPIIMGALSFIIPAEKIKQRNAFVMFTILCSSVSVWALALNTPQGSLTLLNFTDNLSFALKLDGAGKIFSCLSATLWPLTTLYAFEYMSHGKSLPVFYSFFTMAFGATMGIAISGNILTMYLFYELLTLFTAPLVMHGFTKKHNYAVRKYLNYSIGGASFAFAGVAFLIVNDANDFVFGGHITSPSDPTIALVLFVFAFLGFGVKSAVFPLHGWLPTASVAPTPVTALLHAVAVVKAGAFAIIRLIYYSYGTDFLSGTWAQNLVMALAMFTILYGSMTALRQRHFKRRLAYSTISNLSYIVFATTLMTEAGLLAAFCHLLFHSIIKIGAFFSAGAVLHKTGREYVPELEGIGKKMPLTFIFFTISALSLTGIPPFCGFISKWYIATASIEAQNSFAVVGVIILLISAFLTAIYMLAPAIKAFFKSESSTNDISTVKEANALMQVPIAICALLCIVTGLMASNVIELIKGVLSI